MKPGSEYEDFVYGKFRSLFIDATVTKDDRIVGLQSGLQRQIDVSVRLPFLLEPLLYIAQCKDWPEVGGVMPTIQRRDQDWLVQNVKPSPSACHDASPHSPAFATVRFCSTN